jgi:hypothetical protein
VKGDNMNQSLRRLLAFCVLVLAISGGPALHAQAMPTATGAGSYIAVGGGVSAFQSDYDSRYLGGTMIFADLQPEWHVGFEAEARFLRYNTDEGVDQTNYLFGMRTAFHPQVMRPYAKFLVGATMISAPFGYGKGTFFTYAPGAGLDCVIADRITLRLLDVEYQVTPQFIGSNVRNVGISSGVSVRINGFTRLPKTAIFSRVHVKHDRGNDPEFPN